MNNDGWKEDGMTKKTKIEKLKRTGRNKGQKKKRKSRFGSLCSYIYCFVTYGSIKELFQFLMDYQLYNIQYCNSTEIHDNKILMKQWKEKF